jgi:hypothetical protein
MADAFRDRLDSSYKNIGEALKESGLDKRLQVKEENKFVGFDGYKKAIALADVVILATPPGFRPIHFEEAVNQGKQIFMEFAEEEKAHLELLIREYKGLVSRTGRRRGKAAPARRRPRARVTRRQRLT